LTFAHTSYIARFSSVTFLGGACAWATPSTLATLPFLATPSLGDAFFLATPSSWRRLLLATPSSWRRLLLGDAFPWRRFLLGDACRRFERKRIKTKNQGKVFLESSFFFYSGDLIKKPPKGKKSVPFNKIVTWLLT